MRAAASVVGMQMVIIIGEDADGDGDWIREDTF